MRHYGDITKINGAELPIVDIITGGSPCQDLSIAKRNREGLTGERSGLFVEQIRVIREIRNESTRRLQGTDDDIRLLKPRFMVWENVPGALSSNNGEDFRCVLEETAKIVEECANIPRPKKWSNAGCIMGNGWSIAWRIHNSQYWGVPQRRRRLCLVADFNGGTAPNILFELLGEADEGNQDKYCGCIREEYGRKIQDECGCLSRDIEKGEREEQGIATSTIGEIGKAINIVKRPILFDPRSQDGVHRMYDDGICPTLNTAQGGQRQPCVCDSVVRRITPLECERLQGYPDGWTDIGNWTDSEGKIHKTSDTARYKALGNSIALPFWQWLAYRMVNVLKEEGIENPTMGSLFSGIGGFELVYSRAGCKPIFASEIEEFPIAVTKYHFGDD